MLVRLDVLGVTYSINSDYASHATRFEPTLDAGDWQESILHCHRNKVDTSNTLSVSITAGFLSEPCTVDR